MHSGPTQDRIKTWSSHHRRRCRRNLQYTRSTRNSAAKAARNQIVKLTCGPRFSFPRRPPKPGLPLAPSGLGKPPMVLLNMGKLPSRPWSGRDVLKSAVRLGLKSLMTDGRTRQVSAGGFFDVGGCLHNNNNGHQQRWPAQRLPSTAPACGGGSLQLVQSSAKLTVQTNR